MLLSLNLIYVLTGLVLGVISVLTFMDGRNKKRWSTGLFWGLYAITFLFGQSIPPDIMGVVVILIVILAGFGGLGLGDYGERKKEERVRQAALLKNKLFIPVLLIPLITVLGTVVFNKTTLGGIPLLDPKNQTLVSLGLGGVIALIVAMILTRDTPQRAVNESRRLMDAIGWAAILPQMLATLGALFAAGGVGLAISKIVTDIVPAQNTLAVVVAYCVGMALFTMIMGNAFAAFPVMTLGVAVPLLIHMHGANANTLAAIGMFSGYTGTLMTPMAANFNIVPAALLDLPDKYQVIKAQIPTALILLAANICFMYFLALGGRW
ncbi:hypothetical protein CEB3_c44070 [Peptococcaceae bacterium CEB3]|nr:hypothetical protein CEB3_c44070 [Peptococcaceae bacterium CEB3]